MTRGIGRAEPIVNLVTSEMVQLKPALNQNSYDYDVEKLTHTALAKKLTFAKDRRFDNNGIFGDLFDEKKQLRFGNPSASLFDQDKCDKAQLAFSKPRITEQKSFDKYVNKPAHLIEAQTNVKLVDNIFSEEDLRQ